MDAVKILGGLLSQRAARTGGNGAVLGQILNGIADSNAGDHPRQQRQRHDDAVDPRLADPRLADPRQVDPRFDPRFQQPFQDIVRDGVHRHHRGGGRLAPQASQWVQRPEYQPPTVRHAPQPRHGDHHHDHHSGLGYHRRAEILIEAMVMAAQSDGRIDKLEQDRIVDQLQPLDPDEVAFLRREFGRRHDVHAFIHDLPRGMEYEVYQVSLMAIDVDTQLEANYLREFAKCLRIDPQVCNQIHRRCGAVCLW
ncbi:hypothetical protein Poly51_56580 [Rubripirellula tenax]|uniref:Uncharacterized protein n=2 Tax=Rubripirellula tenax TaxID=2528015 RepID=A0A5C6EBA9_9BACT|nr:hypothetical protein Poly51_56580 [Rubripirellula tenax]